MPSKNIDTLIRNYGSFAEFAEAIGVNVRHLNYIRSGKRFPSPIVIDAMAKTLKLSSVEVFTMLTDVRKKNKKPGK